jgi:hypothetical protein
MLNLANDFVELEAENARLREELSNARSLTEQVETANKLAAEASLKIKELEKDLSKTQKKLEAEEKLKKEAVVLAGQKEERLRKATSSLLSK